MNEKIKQLKIVLDELKLTQSKEFIMKLIKEEQDKELKTMYGAKKTSAIKFLEKGISKTRPGLIGYHYFENQFVYTDTYCLVVLNDKIGNEAKQQLNEETIRTLLQGFEIINIDYKEIENEILKDNDFIIVDGITLDPARLKAMIKIIGEASEISTSKNALQIKNKNNEIGILMGIRGGK